MNIKSVPVQLVPYLQPTLGLWVWYRAVMWIKKRRNALKGNKLEYGIAWLFVLCFAIADGVYNLTIGTLIFRQWPKEFYFTSRLKRNKQGSGWRKSLAIWICEELLDKYDPSGEHC